MKKEKKLEIFVFGWIFIVILILLGGIYKETIGSDQVKSDEVAYQQQIEEALKNRQNKYIDQLYEGVDFKTKANEFVMNFPDSIDRVKVVKFIEKNANDVIIHIRQIHFSPNDYDFEEVNQTNQVQDNIYEIVMWLHKNYGLKYIFGEGRYGDVQDKFEKEKNDNQMIDEFYSSSDIDLKNNLKENWFEMVNSKEELRILSKELEFEKDPLQRADILVDIERTKIDAEKSESLFILNRNILFLRYEITERLLNEKIVSVKPAEIEFFYNRASAVDEKIRSFLWKGK